MVKGVQLARGIDETSLVDKKLCLSFLFASWTASKTVRSLVRLSKPESVLMQMQRLLMPIRVQLIIRSLIVDPRISLVPTEKVIFIRLYTIGLLRKSLYHEERSNRTAWRMLLPYVNQSISKFTKHFYSSVVYFRHIRRTVIIRRGAMRNPKQAVYQIYILCLRLSWYMYGACRMQNTKGKDIQI